MCSNFIPASIASVEKIVSKQLPMEMAEHTKHVYPKGICPIIIDDNQVVLAQFGLSPSWATEPVKYSTYNARIENIKQKRTFKSAWNKSRFCLVPMQAFFEPHYAHADAKNDWQRIYKKDNAPFTIAGLYEYNERFEVPIHSFTLLTHDATDEPFMNQFHHPNDEKRSVFEVDAEYREAFLVQNKTNIDEYMQPISSDAYTHTSKQAAESNQPLLDL